MIDNYNYSWKYALICYMAYFVMLYIAKPLQSYHSPLRNSINVTCRYFFLLVILINVFSFWEYDTYHTWELFENRSFISVYGVEAFEEVYNYLSIVAAGNYFLWRLFVWGSAFLFIYGTAHLLEIRNRHFLTATALFLAFAGYSRVILGCSMLVYGCTAFYKSERYWKKAIALLIIAASYYFHKSMYVNIAFAIIAIFPISKHSFRTLLILYPFLTATTTYIVNNMSMALMLTGLGSEVGGNSIDGGFSYIEQERSIANLTGLITQIITLAPTYISMFYIARRILQEEVLKADRNKTVITYLFKYSFIAIYIASLFYFTEVLSWIYIRFMNMAVYPLAIALAYIWSMETKKTKWAQSIIIIQLIGLFIVHFVRLYHGMGF